MKDAVLLELAAIEKQFGSGFGNDEVDIKVSLGTLRRWIKELENTAVREAQQKG